MAAQIFQVAEDERLFLVKPKGDEVLGIVHPVFQRFLERSTILEQRLLVVRQHEHQRDVKDVLQPLRELQRYSVAQVQASGTRTSTGVKEETLAALVGV